MPYFTLKFVGIFQGGYFFQKEWDQQISILGAVGGVISLMNLRGFCFRKLPFGDKAKFRNLYYKDLKNKPQLPNSYGKSYDTPRFSTK